MWQVYGLIKCITGVKVAGLRLYEEYYRCQGGRFPA